MQGLAFLHPPASLPIILFWLLSVFCCVIGLFAPPAGLPETPQCCVPSAGLPGALNFPALACPLPRPVRLGMEPRRPATDQDLICALYFP